MPFTFFSYFLIHNETEAVAGSCPITKMFLRFLQNSQENFTGVYFFSRIAGLQFSNLLNKRLWHRCFLINITKNFRTFFFTEHVRIDCFCRNFRYTIVKSHTQAINRSNRSHAVQMATQFWALALLWGIIHLVRTQNFPKN